MKILGLALSVEPRFSLAEYTHPINGPVYLDQITTIRKYEIKNYNGYTSPQRFLKEYHEKRDILQELEGYGLKIK